MVDLVTVNSSAALCVSFWKISPSFSRVSDGSKSRHSSHSAAFCLLFEAIKWSLKALVYG